MAIDLIPLYNRIAASSLLSDSVGLLVGGLADLFDANTAADVAAALRGLVTHPDDANQQIAAGALLGQALTRNTSHVAVAVDDPLIPHVRTAFELPRKDRAVHVAAIQYAISAPVLDIAAELATTQADKATAQAGQATASADLSKAQVDLAAAQGQAVTLVAQLDAKDAQLATATAIVTARDQQVAALDAQAAAKDDTIAAKDAQIAALQAKLDAKDAGAAEAKP